MYVNHKVHMDLTNRGNVPMIDVVREDANSRRISFMLRAGFDLWRPPEDAAVLIRYQKEDGTGGEYDTLPDGTAAYEINGCSVSILLAPQVLTVEGNVDLSVTLIHEDSQLSTFQIKLNVTGKVPSPEESEDYFHVTGFIPQPEKAEAGQYLEVSEVDEYGRIKAVRAVEAPESSGAELPENVVICNLTGSMDNTNVLPVNSDTLGGHSPAYYKQIDAATAYVREELLGMTGKNKIPVTISTQSGSAFSQGDGTIICTKAGYVLVQGFVETWYFTTNNVYHGFFITVNDAVIAEKYTSSAATNGLVIPAVVAPVSVGDEITLNIELYETTGSVMKRIRTGMTVIYLG